MQAHKLVSVGVPGWDKHFVTGKVNGSRPVPNCPFAAIKGFGQGCDYCGIIFHGKFFPYVMLCGRGRMPPADHSES
jgi:hypothetical protein